MFGVKAKLISLKLLTQCVTKDKGKVKIRKSQIQTSPTQFI